MKSVCNKSMAVFWAYRVLQNLNQFTLKNHEKLNKIDIWR